MATDLEKDLEAVGARNVLGVGHSLGGVLTLWASIHRPHLFRAIVLVDPVILPVSQLRMLRLLNFVGLGRRHALVQRTLRRRQEWPSRQACFDHLRGKPLFDLWSDTALLDYVHYGTRARDDGSVELTYPPAWEAQIFATPPTGIWRDLRQVQVPCLFIRGELSSTFRAESLRRIGRLLPHASLVTLPGGGHLLPMEIPQAVGAAIRRFFDGLAPS
jgi:pimeloyl-ACP methyl ester carboxylesterase